MEKTNVRELQDVVIRFSGDSGDGMQLTGTLFSDTSALLGNGISTFPDYPAEIRAPQGTVAGVSGFQVHFGSHRELNPGDYCDVLVAMNPAALKANRKWLKQGATVIIDGDSITEEHLKKAGFATLDPIAELGLDEYNVVIPDITSMTREALKQTGLDNKAVVKCKNMFALGICFYLFDRPEAYAYKYLETKFARKNPVVAEANKLAIDAGYNYAANTHQFANTYTVSPAPLEKGTYRTINGNVATAWGLCAAAEKAGLPLFCGSYPITPATVILEELAKRKDLGVKTVQAEDEIAGICTAIGAGFYTGGTVCYAFILLAMNVLRLVDVRIQSRQKTATVYFELRSKLSIGQLVRLAREKDCTLSELELYADSGYGDNLVCGTFTLWAEGRTSLDDILRELSAVEGVIYLTRI